MAFRYQPDHDGLNEIARSPAVRAALAAAATKAKGIAEAMSEDFRTDQKHQHYADSFKVEEGTVDWIGQYPGRRGAAYLVNDSDHALAVEWGNGRDGEAHHVLGRTLGMLDA